MATDFFERQATARRSTGWLLVMFSLATIAVVISIMAVAAIGMGAVSANSNSPSGSNTNPLQIALLARGATLLLILGGSLFKVMELRAGGGALAAERMGGVRIFPNTTNLVERRLLNVVEEMAIASGVIVPPVFLLPHEQGINAFAAGYSANDAVLGVTRGCESSSPESHAYSGGSKTRPRPHIPKTESAAKR
ncbi:MAG: hypothetical protein ABI614_15740 [Planctomycetota bacterium]